MEVEQCATMDSEGGYNRRKMVDVSPCYQHPSGMIVVEEAEVVDKQLNVFGHRTAGLAPC